MQKDFYLSLVANKQIPAQDCYLIPIRLDVDVDGYRYIDSFSWNLWAHNVYHNDIALIDVIAFVKDTSRILHSKPLQLPLSVI